jgi:hypothetical protein
MYADRDSLCVRYLTHSKKSELAEDERRIGNAIRPVATSAREALQKRSSKDRDMMRGGVNCCALGWGMKQLTLAAVEFELLRQDDAAGFVSCRDGAGCAVVGDRAVLSEAGQMAARRSGSSV